MSIGAGKGGACPTRTPLRPTVYPTTACGTAGVPCYGAGPFVWSRHKWTACTTELQPNWECKHRPPQGETPEEGNPARVKPLPSTHPHRTPTKARVVPEQTPGEQHARQRTKDEEGGEHARGRRGNAPPPADPSLEWRGTTPRPLSQDRRGTTTHNLHTHAEPATQARRGEGRQPNTPPTHHSRTRWRGCGVLVCRRVAKCQRAWSKSPGPWLVGRPQPGVPW